MYDGGEVRESGTGGGSRLWAHSLSKHATVRRLPENLATILSCSCSSHSHSHSLASVSSQLQQQQTINRNNNYNIIIISKVHKQRSHIHITLSVYIYIYTRYIYISRSRLRFASFVRFSLNIAYLHPRVPLSHLCLSLSLYLSLSFGLSSCQ